MILQTSVWAITKLLLFLCLCLTPPHNLTIRRHPSSSSNTLQENSPTEILKPLYPQNSEHKIKTTADDSAARKCNQGPWPTYAEIAIGEEDRKCSKNAYMGSQMIVVRCADREEAWEFVAEQEEFTWSRTQRSRSSSNVVGFWDVVVVEAFGIWCVLTMFLRGTLTGISWNHVILAYSPLVPELKIESSLHRSHSQVSPHEEEWRWC